MDYLGQGVLPASPTRAQLLWFLAANYHVWASNVPLWELPADVGGEFLDLCRHLQPMNWVYLQQLIDGQDAR